MDHTAGDPTEGEIQASPVEEKGAVGSAVNADNDKPRGGDGDETDDDKDEDASMHTAKDDFDEEGGDEVVGEMGSDDDDDDKNSNKNNKEDENKIINDGDEDDENDDDDNEEAGHGADTEGDDNDSVATSGTTESHDGTADEEDTDMKPLPSHIPNHLDRRSLHGIKLFLQGYEARNALDDDEMAIIMTKVDRNVEHRVRYHTNPLDDIVDEEKMDRTFHKEEEEYLIAHDFIKEMTSTIQRTTKRSLDKRTVNWVKRAAGLHRTDYHSPHSALGNDGNESDQDGTGKRAPRRYTRGMARSTRIKKKEEFIFKDNLGLKSLLDAIEELEPESGPYPVPFECRRAREKTRISDRRRPASSSRSNEDEFRKQAKRKDSGDIGHPLVARFTDRDIIEGNSRNPNFIFGDFRDILITKVLVNGVHVEEDDEDRMSMRERKKELKRMRDRQYQKRKRDQKNREKEQRKAGTQYGSKYTTPQRSNTGKRRREGDDYTDDEDQPRRKPRSSRSGVGTASGGWLKGPVSLPLLDWRRRQMWTPSGKSRNENDQQMVETKFDIPAHLRRQGIGHRFPAWESVNLASIPSDQVTRSDPPRGRHSDDVYASWSHKLINSLNGSARDWAIHEFFYSDVDRPWYNENLFVKAVSKLGIPPTAKLTRKEWSAVRRMIPGRPRRFSKKFVFSQLKERNKYRNMVRHLQRNPDETNQTGYEIPAPIRPGQTITAYNKKFLIISRGVVLFHDVSTARYLVQFEREELGVEFCSDTEVASHGLPKILIPCAPHKLTGSPFAGGLKDIPRMGALPYGTSNSPLPLSTSKQAASCEMEASKLLSRKNGNQKEEKKSSNVSIAEKVAERDTLVTLMTIIDTATSRKAMLLNAIEKFNALMVDRLPFGGNPPATHVVSPFFEQHFAWLRANLEATNHTLDLSFSFMKTMYGKCCTSIPEVIRQRAEARNKIFSETVLGQNLQYIGAPPAATMPWVGALFHGSKDVGKYLASLLCRQNDVTLPTEDSDNKHMQNRIAVAGGILAAIGYCCGRSEESDISVPTGDPPVLDIVLAAGLDDISFANPASAEKDCPEQRDDRLIFRAEAEKAAAERELKDSFALLSKEFRSQSFASRSS